MIIEAHGRTSPEEFVAWELQRVGMVAVKSCMKRSSYMLTTVCLIIRPQPLDIQNTRVFGCLVLISWLFACLLTEYGCRDNNTHYFHCKPTADASNGPQINIFDPHRFRWRLLMAAEERRKTCLAAPVRPGCWHLSASCIWVIKRSSVTIRKKKL